VEPRSIEAIDVDSRASVFVPLKVTLSPSSQVFIHSLPFLCSSLVLGVQTKRYQGVLMPLNLPCTVICEVSCHRCLGSYVSSLVACHIAAMCLLLVQPEVNACCFSCKLCLSQKALNASGHLMLQQLLQQLCILRPVTSRLSGNVLQVSDVASNELSATDPICADRDGTAHSTDSGEGVTPAGPSFSRPAPCLLPESHQASPATSSENSTSSKTCRSSTI